MSSVLNSHWQLALCMCSLCCYYLGGVGDLLTGFELGSETSQSLCILARSVGCSVEVDLRKGKFGGRETSRRYFNSLGVR